MVTKNTKKREAQQVVARLLAAVDRQIAASEEARAARDELAKLAQPIALSRDSDAEGK